MSCYAYHKFLKNGLKVIYCPDENSELFTIQLFVKMGSNWEDKSQSGYSHLCEHLVFKSTKQYPDNTLMEKASELGGSIDAYTEYDCTSFYLTVPYKLQRKAISLLSELAYNANFDDEQFNLEKQVVIEEYNQYKDDPEESFIEDIPAVYFSKNPYKNPIIGNKKSLVNAKPDDLRNFYNKYYSPNNCFIVIAGKFQKNITSIINEFFINWQQKPEINHQSFTGDFIDKTKLFTFKQDLKSNMLAFAIPEVSEQNKLSHAVSLVSKIFCVDKNSRLYNRLVIKDKLADHIRVHSVCGINDGISIIQILPKINADLYKICDAFWDEFDKLRTFGINYDELNNHKNELKFAYRYSSEYIEALAMSLGSDEVIESYKNYNNYLSELNMVDQDQINQVLKTYYKTKHVGIFYKGKKDIEESKVTYRKKVLNVPSTDIKQTNGFTQCTLSTKAKLVFKKTPNKPTVGIALSIPVSQQYENQNQKGLNHLCATSLLFGNKKFSHSELINYCKSRGITISVSTHYEVTTIKMKCFKELLPQCLEILSDVIFTPTFPKEQITSFKNSLISTIERAKDFPAHVAGEMFKKQLLGENSTLIDKQGTKKSIKSLSINDIRQWHSYWYKPENTTICVVGDTNFANLALLINNCFKKYKATQTTLVTNPSKAEIKICPAVKKVKNINNEQAYVYLGACGPSTANKQQATAFNVLSQIIGGDINSRLFQELREKRGWAYSCGFESIATKNFGFWYCYGSVDKNNYKQTIEIIKQTLTDIKTNSVTKAEILRSKNYIKGQRLNDEESVLTQAHIISVLVSSNLGLQHYIDRQNRLDLVKINDLKQIANTYFDENNYHISVLV